MKRCILTVILAVAACGGDKPSSPAATAPPAGKGAEKAGAEVVVDTAANSAECLRLEDHVFEIMPNPDTGHGEPDPKRRADLVAQLPIEDIEQCAAVKDRKIIACMLQARDVTALRACIPPATE